MRVLARGVRKTTSRLGASLETLAYVRVDLVKTRGEFYVARHVAHRERLEHLRSSYPRISAGYAVVEAIDAIPSDGVGDDGIFDLLVRVLRTLDDVRFDPDARARVVLLSPAGPRRLRAGRRRVRQLRARGSPRRLRRAGRGRPVRELPPAAPRSRRPRSPCCGGWWGATSRAVLRDEPPAGAGEVMALAQAAIEGPLRPATARARLGRAARRAARPVGSGRSHHHDPMTPSILWFRRDLRLADHPALLEAVRRGDGAVVALFVVDDDFLAPCGATRAAYLRATLEALDVAIGGRLVVRVASRRRSWRLSRREVGATQVLASEDFGPRGRARDAHVARALASRGVPSSLLDGPYAVAPGTVTTRAGTPCRVFGAYQRGWAASRSHAGARAARRDVGRGARRGRRRSSPLAPSDDAVRPSSTACPTRPRRTHPPPAKLRRSDSSPPSPRGWATTPQRGTSPGSRAPVASAPACALARCTPVRSSRRPNRTTRGPSRARSPGASSTRTSSSITPTRPARTSRAALAP